MVIRLRPVRGDAAILTSGNGLRRRLSDLAAIGSPLRHSSRSLMAMMNTGRRRDEIGQPDATSRSNHRHWLLRGYLTPTPTLPLSGGGGAPRPRYRIASM